MKKLLLLPLSLLCLFLSCNNATSADAPTGGKLYIRQFFWAMNNTIEIKWIYLGNDGTIVMQPLHGNAPVNVAEEKKDNEYAGTYKMSGDQMNITWADGSKESWYTQKKNGIFTALNKGPVVLADPLPSSFRFNKEFPIYTFLQGEDNLHKIQFNSNGTFTFIKSPYAESSIPDQTTGSYSVNKNTLIMKFPDGKTVFTNIGIIKGGSKAGSRQLLINTQFEEL